MLFTLRLNAQSVIISLNHILHHILYFGLPIMIFYTVFAESLFRFSFDVQIAKDFLGVIY
jgi:hypothetical protein